MYKIEKKDYGYRLTFNGFIKIDEMAKWVDESKQALTGQEGKFGVFVDMRGLNTLPQDSKVKMEEGQKLFKQTGMERSVVILDDAITTMQFMRIAQETGIYEWERYIDASKELNWDKAGLDWIKDGIDPDN